MEDELASDRPYYICRFLLLKFEFNNIKPFSVTSPLYIERALMTCEIKSVITTMGQGETVGCLLCNLCIVFWVIDEQICLATVSARMNSDMFPLFDLGFAMSSYFSSCELTF